MKARCWLLTVLSAVLLCACSAQQREEGIGVGYFALKGPPLALSGSYKELVLEGWMDRRVMVGLGTIELRSVNRELGFFCEGRLNVQPTGKGRIRGVLRCSEEVLFLITLKANGPDQGVGIGLTDSGLEPLLFFFHPCKDEAQRRFPDEQKILLQALEAIPVP